MEAFILGTQNLVLVRTDSFLSPQSFTETFCFEVPEKRLLGIYTGAFVVVGLYSLGLTVRTPEGLVDSQRLSHAVSR